MCDGLWDEIRVIPHINTLTLEIEKGLVLKIIFIITTLEIQIVEKTNFRQIRQMGHIKK